MTAYVECQECGGGVPWFYAWIWHPKIAMHPGCAKDRWDEEGAGAMGPAIREASAALSQSDLKKIARARSSQGRSTRF